MGAVAELNVDTELDMAERGTGWWGRAISVGAGGRLTEGCPALSIAAMGCIGGIVGADWAGAVLTGTGGLALEPWLLQATSQLSLLRQAFFNLPWPPYRF